jgi:8-oxo-dGTP pyrophosphatase MutT (NUDIX family)
MASIGPAQPWSETEGKPAAVLVALFEERGEARVVLTRRAATLRSHTGEVAFPGGRLEPGEEPLTAALREAAEEVGLNPASVEVVTELPQLWIPVTGFVVTPVLAWWRTPSPVDAVDRGEVARAVRVPVAELLDPANRFLVTHPSGWVGPGFTARGLFVWGFTAGVLDRVLALAGWERPWSRDRLEPAPLPAAPLEDTLVAERIPGEAS